VGVSGDVNTDRRYLTEQQYANDDNLAARQSIYSFLRPAMDIFNGSLDLADLRGDESILDVGCGNGRYLGVLRTRGHRGLVCGADLSEGMLRSARSVSDGRLLLVDAQTLPFADDAFDVTLSMHMLYHVPDRRVAIAELRRVLRPAGVALVATNYATHLQELEDLLLECAGVVDGVDWRQARNPITFTAENGSAELEAAFASVMLHEFTSELVIDEVEPVLTYARSMNALVGDTEHELDPVIPELEQRVRDTIAEHGALRVRTAVGCFVCR
jgi:SAM-dependent methyltransferase